MFPFLRVLSRNLVLLCFCLFFSGISFSQELNNQLKNHPAPYLALHGDDPVNWQEWGEETVEYARSHNKILFLSIGYFACHWCHVMQQESYQDPGISKIINEFFVPVKIDRELDPALDRRLMDFTQRILGRGGWPLNVFITPDGYPIYSLLYAPPKQFTETLNRLKTLWTTDQQKVLDVVRSETIQHFANAEPVIDPETTIPMFDYAAQKIIARADMLEGGFGQQQKFPSTPQLGYLLTQLAINPDEELETFLTLSLDSMADLGMRDQLVGGFFRYSIDPSWELPHFEKMLYDNANLASLYMQAARVLASTDTSENEKAAHYETIARNTLDFMHTEMWHPDGAMMAAFSAVDDQSIEGGSYLWKPEEIQEILTKEEASLIFAVWGLNRKIDLPVGNQPRYVQSVIQYAQEQPLNLKRTQEIFQSAKKKMIEARKMRSLPVDDKLLASWNGLALSAFVQASQQFPGQGYGDIAKQLRDFLVNKLWDGEKLHRAQAKGMRIGAGSLEDYAYVSHALYQWAMLPGNKSDLEIVSRMVNEGWRRFHENNGWYAGDDTLLAPTSGSEIIADSANPSPSAELILVTLKLAKIQNNTSLREMALSALNRGESELTIAPFWYVGQLAALRQAVSDPR